MSLHPVLTSVPHRDVESLHLSRHVFYRASTWVVVIVRSYVLLL